MSDAFDKWINSFTDEDYEEMLDDSNPFGFTDAQKSKALNLRAEPTPEQLEDFTLEQEFEEIEKPEEIEEPSGAPVKEPKGILPKIRRFLTKVEQEQGAPIEIEQITIRKPLGGGAPIRTEPTIGIEGMKMTRPPIALPPKVLPPKPPTAIAGIKSAILGAGKFIRRFFRV